jgi:hypothetical protein
LLRRCLPVAALKVRAIAPCGSRPWLTEARLRPLLLVEGGAEFAAADAMSEFMR